MLDFTRFQAMTFDCYGTLIDWEKGLLDALRPFAARATPPTPDTDALLECYARHEAAGERGPFRPYRDVMREALNGVARELGLEVRPGEEDALARSIALWPAFPDTADALRRLKPRFRLCVCSNIDRDLFQGSRPKLGVDLDGLVTAEDVRSYKPAPGHFERAPNALGVPKERILHVAQSLYHDIAPARELGYATVWVNRQRGRWGATPRVMGDVRADVEVASMAQLAEAVGV
jgi:2-haloacid dehalogenase